MIKTTTLTKALFSHQMHPHSITLFTPSTTSSSGSASETRLSSPSSSYKSNYDKSGTYINEDVNAIPQDKSALVLIALVDKLKRELATVKQAKTQLETLYKVKCKSDLDKSAKITKLRLQYEYELNTFCKQDQKDLVQYLQRQLISREQRIAEQAYELEQLKSSSINANLDGNNTNVQRRTVPIQILKNGDFDMTIPSNQHLYDEQEHTCQRQNIELHERVKRFERQLEVLKQDQPRDHERELIKRALAKQASKDAAEYQKLLKQKNQEIEELNIRLEQLSKFNLLESALRQVNIEKLHLERRFLMTTGLSSSLKSQLNANSSTVPNASHVAEQQPYPIPTSARSRADSSTAHSIDPFHYQALQDTNEALKSEVHRLARVDEENMAKLKLQLEKYTELDDAYKHLEEKYTNLVNVEARFNELQDKYNTEKSTYEYCLHENEQLKCQNEHLLNELARLTQVETRDRARSAEQADLRRQYDELFNQFNELKQNYNALKDNYEENQISYENDIKHLEEEISKCRTENEQLRVSNDLLYDERNQMKESHETVLKKRFEEIRCLQIENRDLQTIRHKYNEERDMFQAIDLKKTQLENDLLTMHAVEDRCQDLQTTVERLETEVQLSQRKLDDHAMVVTNLNKENARLIKELESASMLNTQMRAEISNATNTNERLTEECDRHRTNFLMKADECDTKRRENEQLLNKIHELELAIKSLRDASDLNKQINVENEVNKLELKRKQDDFEQFQKMHDATKRENLETIHLLEEKIHDLERKTELQSLKHEEILLEFESLKARRDRVLPPSSGTIISSNHPSTFPPAHRWSSPTMVDGQTSPINDSPSPAALPTTRVQPSVKSIASQSVPVNENAENKQKPAFNNQAAQIVIAKYSYEPLQCSPNDHPEVELPLNLGEYYLIYGDVDEDGFYDGRNLEGRYGLIPSNFIEIVTNLNELPETIRHIVQRLTGKIISDETITPRRDPNTSIDSDILATNSSTSTPAMIRKQTTPALNMNVPDASTTNGLSFGKHVPCPTNLRIEKYLSNSILIAWNPPSTTLQVLGYQILLDHALYTTLRANERTRALIENINLNEKFHRISIRTISQQGLSRDQECTLLLAMPATNTNDLSYAPSDLRVDRINQTSAVVSWWPASNDIVHKLFVNDIEVQTLTAGVYRFKLSGLLPNTVHKVTIKARPNNATSAQQSLAASIEFSTTSFDESIEPPKRVQVIAGPQANTLLVSWEQPSSTTTAIRGYRVLVDGRQIQDIINPLNDHSVININTLHHGKFLTVRAITENNGESHDSTPIDLDEILKKLDTDTSSTTIIPATVEENFDKESIPLTASSSLTLRTTSDEELATKEPTPQPNPPTIVETPQKTPLRTQEIISGPPISVPTVKQPSTTVAQIPATSPPSIKTSTTPTTNPDKIRPITKNSTRPPGIQPIQSQLKSSSAGPVSTDVPQIEINSPSPNSSNISSATTTTTTTTAAATTIKSKSDNRDLYEQPQSRFGYDTYTKPVDDSASYGKANTSQRKTNKTSTTMSPVKQRDHSDTRRATTAIPMNGNPTLNKTKAASARHASTSSEEQHSVPPTPMKTVKLKEQTPPQPVPSANNHLYSKANSTPRLFIALFDYDPNEMSPNKDNEEELPFRKGQIIRIFGDQDADGFYVGQTDNGRMGYVPSNMVSEIQLDDAEIEAHLRAGTINLENPSRMTATATPPTTTVTPPMVPAITTTTPTSKRTPSATNSPSMKPPSQTVKKMMAMFDYNPTEHSPNMNPDEELSFHSGDIIYVHGNVHDDGFYLGELENGMKGLVPSNFLKEISSINIDDSRTQHDNDAMIPNEPKKTSHRRGPHQV